METADFAYMRKFILDHTAIVLEQGKEYLVETRLMPILKQEKFDSMSAFVEALRTKAFGPLHQKVIDAMTTNETLFFRDLHPFEALKKNIFPELMAKRAAEKKITMWCAASSSGQEPYSLAMLLKESFPQLADWGINYIASDVSDTMLERCRKGVFHQIEVNRGLPVLYLAKYFEKSGADWQIKEGIRKMVDFRKINLVTAWPPLPFFDIIFIRNVLIYFDIEVKKAILAKARALLKKDGYLFLGGAETTMNLDDNFERVIFDKATCYRLRQK